MIPKITQKVPALWNSIGVGTVAPASPIQVNFGGKYPRKHGNTAQFAASRLSTIRRNTPNGRSRTASDAAAG